MNAKEEYREYLQSPHWSEKRKAINARALGRCEMCGDGGEEVHHITYENLWAEKDHELIMLCRCCHQRAHDDDAFGWRVKLRAVEAADKASDPLCFCPMCLGLVGSDWAEKDGKEIYKDFQKKGNL